jgi:hypothetical protein
MTIIRNGKGTIVPNDPSRNRVLRLFRDGRISYKIRLALVSLVSFCDLFDGNNDQN